MRTMMDAVLVGALHMLDMDVKGWLDEFNSFEIEDVRTRPYVEMNEAFTRRHDRFDGLALSNANVRKDEAGQMVRAARLMLGDGIHYSSSTPNREATETEGWAFPSTPAMPAFIQVDRCLWPDSVSIGIVGMRVGEVIAHPLLMHDDMIITGVRRDASPDGGLCIEIAQVSIDMTEEIR